MKTATFVLAASLFLAACGGGEEQQPDCNPCPGFTSERVELDGRDALRCWCTGTASDRLGFVFDYSAAGSPACASSAATFEAVADLCAAP